jgi:hypothetical protein
VLLLLLLLLLLLQQCLMQVGAPKLSIPCPPPAAAA